MWQHHHVNQWNQVFVYNCNATPKELIEMCLFSWYIVKTTISKDYQFSLIPCRLNPQYSTMLNWLFIENYSSWWCILLSQWKDLSQTTPPVWGNIDFYLFLRYCWVVMNNVEKMLNLDGEKQQLRVEKAPEKSQTFESNN